MPRYDFECSSCGNTQEFRVHRIDEQCSDSNCKICNDIKCDLCGDGTLLRMFPKSVSVIKSGGEEKTKDASNHTNTMPDANVYLSNVTSTDNGGAGMYVKNMKMHARNVHLDNNNPNYK